jgi:hypothetical protein
MTNLKKLKELSYGSWISLIEDWIQSSAVEPKASERALKCFLEYLNEAGQRLEWNEVTREGHIHNLKGDGFTFRQWLIKKIPSNQGKNQILFFLHKFYDYQILKSQAIDLDFSLLNPVDFRWDRFKVVNKTGTSRQALPLEVMEEMRRVLIEDDFKWSRENFKSDLIKELFSHKTGELDRNVFSLSTTLALYLLLTIPLRGLQVQLLDSGERDEWTYDFDKRIMVKNKNGEKGRQEGFIRKVFYSGVGLDEKESLWITTNKSAGTGYEIPWVSEEIIRLIGIQSLFLKKYSPNPMAVDKSSVVGKVSNKRLPKFYCLFRDVGAGNKPINKNKLYRLWGFLCLEIERRFKKRGIFLRLTDGYVNGRVNFLYDLHSLRVSSITAALEAGIRLETVSKFFVGHSDEKMTQYYQRIKGLRELVKVSQDQVVGGFNFNVKLLEKNK